MGNEFISVKEIARQALPRLIENLVFPNLVHKDFSNDYILGLGDTIQVRKPVVFEATEFNPASGTSPSDIVETSVDVKLDKIATVDAKITALEGATSMDSLTRLFIEPAAAALAQKINSDGLNLYSDIPYRVGTAGTTPSTLADFANAEKVLNNNKAPVSPRYAVWNPDADASFKQLAAIVNAEKSGTTKALRDGSIGKVFGLENFMSQAIKNHTPGKLTLTGTGAAAKIKTAVTNKSTFIIKVTVSSGTGTLTGSLKKGDMLSIGTPAVVCTVAKDTTAADDEITVNVYETVTLSAGDVVTVGAAYAANLAFHPMAFAFVTRPLVAPKGVESYTTSYNGVSLRVVRGYDMKYKEEMLSMDVLYGYKTLYPELAVKILG